MPKWKDIPISQSPLPTDTTVSTLEAGGNGLSSPFMTTIEAAQYLRKSDSWLLRQPDIPYLKGTPNTYKKQDLDDWFELHKCQPRVA